MKQKLLALACASLATIVIAGCKPQAPVEPAAPAPTVAEPAGPAAATAPAPTADAAAKSAPALDQKGFAGTFSGDNATVKLNPDGTFALNGPKASFDGTWTAEENGERVRLDPNSKAEPDRVYAVVGSDEIRALAADGSPVDTATVLHREGATH
jgi:hypothetical protein